MTIVAEQLVTAVDELTLEGRPVMVHASLRSFGDQINGGADAILDALVSRGCTVMVPAFTEPQFAVTPPVTMRPPRNGIDYHQPPGTTPAADPTTAYTVGCGVINPGMGTLPATLIARQGAHRGRHPLNSFAALGPQAAELIEPQEPADVYAPLRVLAEQHGVVLLIGVGLNRMTALHLAEQRSGRRLLIRWARRCDGGVCMVETGSCSEGFPRLDPHLGGYAQRTCVAAARWSAYPARETLDAAVAAMIADQDITRCPKDTCLRCLDSIAGGPIGPTPLG